jgi:cytoskeletal protein RodZ
MALVLKLPGLAGDLGARLKQARQHRGVSLRDIATATKISVVALEALERNDYSRLPGGIFSRAFVRAYALAVGVEPEEAVNEFLVDFTRWEKERERSKKRPEITADDREFLERQRRALRTFRMVLVVVVLVVVSAGSYAAWAWWPK